MEEGSLPGLRARYEFAPAGESVELKLSLGFEPVDPDARAAAREAWLALRDRLAGGAEGAPPPPEVRLVTSLAAAPLAATADGGGLLQPLAAFAAGVVAAFDGADAGGAELVFKLAKAGAAGLPRDIFELEVRVELGGDRPVPVAVASPKLAGDPGAVHFAAAFEQAWQGLGGTGSRLALAEGGEPGQPDYWCVKAGGALGIALARPPSDEATHYALPPLSTVPLDGTIEDADGKGAAEPFKAIDLDRWWDIFAAEFERAAALAGGETRERLEHVRGALARALAERLVLVAGAETGEGVDVVRAVLESAAAADLRSRPAVVSAAVEVVRGATSPGEPAAVLRGRAAAPLGTSSRAGASPAAVRLEAGRRRLAYVAPTVPEGQPGPAFPIRFEGEWVERHGAPPLRLILFGASGDNPLEVDLGARPAPMPLIALPDAPAFAGLAARSSAGAATLDSALAWAVEIEMAARPAAQDRLELALGFEENAVPDLQPKAVPGALFDRLGRAARFAGSAPAEPDAGSLARFAGLAEAVAEALPRWQPPSPDIQPLPGDWHYSIDFGDLPALIVGCEAQDCGQYPPWLAIKGHAMAQAETGTARFEPEAGASTDTELRLTLSGLRLPADRIVQVRARIRRNGGIAEAVDPAFVYHSGIESSLALRPSLEWQAPGTEPRASSLEAALVALLGAIGEGSQRPYALALEAALVRRLEAAVQEPLETLIPLASLPWTLIGGETHMGAPDLARRVAAGISVARAGIDPDRTTGEIALAITLFDEASEAVPLARLRFRIPASGDAWWEPAAV